MRAFYKGGMGLATVQSLKAADVRRCGRLAAQLAKASHPDPDFVALPEPSEAPEVPGLFDEKVAGLPAETVVRWCRQAIEEAKAVEATARVSGGAGFTVGDGEGPGV